MGKSSDLSGVGFPEFCSNFSPDFPDEKKDRILFYFILNLSLNLLLLLFAKFIYPQIQPPLIPEGFIFLVEFEGGSWISKKIKAVNYFSVEFKDGLGKI